jgi:glycolate oxidase FAD binding subunit
VAQAVAAMAAALTSPCEVTGAAHDPESRVTRFRIEGFAGSVAYRAGRLAEILRPWGPAAISRDAAAIARTWAAIRDVTDLAGRDGDLWRLSLRASEAPDVLARAGFLAARLDWGGGLIWGLAPGGTDLRARIGRMSGHATLLRAAPATFARIPAWPPEAPAVAALSAGLRARFDPRGILGPGAGGH